MTLKIPKTNEILRKTHASKTVLRFLNERRSNLAKVMTGPGPSKDDRDLILRLAARVPDHRKLSPWRFILFEGKNRAIFGDHLAARFDTLNPNCDPERTAFERLRFTRAPLVVAVISSPVECPRGTPKWEQELSAGAVCMNMLLAARASGFAAQWLTEWYAFDLVINQALQLKDAERVAGFIYIGQAKEAPKERQRPILKNIVSKWRPLT